MFISLTKFVQRSTNMKGIDYINKYVLRWLEPKNKYLTNVLYQRLCISNN